MSHFRRCDCGQLASPGWFPFPPTLLPSLRPLVLSPDPAFISVGETASPSTGELRDEFIGPCLFLVALALSSLLVRTFPSGEGEAGLASSLRDNSEESCRFCHPWLLLLQKKDFFFLSPSSSFFRKHVPTGSEKRAHIGNDVPFRPPTLLSPLQGAWPLRGILLRGGHPPLLHPEVCVQPSEGGVPQTLRSFGDNPLLSLGAHWRGDMGPPRGCSQVTTVGLTAVRAPFPPSFRPSLEGRRSLMC